MIPVTVKKISFHPPSRSYAVMLKEIEGQRVLPVIVGSFEAQAIALAMEYVETPRPLTHDLIGAVISGVEAKLMTIKISRLSDGVFYANMEIETEETGKSVIDARPSDALAVGLRLKVPIFVHEDVMAEAGVPEDSIEDKLVKKTKMKISVKEIEKKLELAIEKEEYEKAAILRDKIKNMTA